MSKEENGGAAFPQSGFERWAPEGGITKREYLAAKAMVGLLSNPNCVNNPEHVARMSYMHADAMLAEGES